MNIAFMQGSARCIHCIGRSELHEVSLAILFLTAASWVGIYLAIQLLRAVNTQKTVLPFINKDVNAIGDAHVHTVVPMMG